MSRLLAIGTVFVALALGGCTTAPQRPLYEGVLTGEKLDDRWVVRVPPIEVGARRRDVEPPR